MPKHLCTNTDIHWSVERPVTLSVVKDVERITGIACDVQLNFFGPEGKRYQKQNNVIPGQPEDSFGFNEQVTVDVQEEFDLDAVLSSALSRPEHHPIFRDDDLRFYIKPVYAQTKVTVAFKYRSSDRNQALMWRNQMHMLATAYVSVLLHEVEYDYQLNEEVLEIVMEVWKLRETVEGYGESASEYFTKRLSPKAHLMSSQNGKSKAWAIKEKQTEVQGYFEFEKIPEKAEKESHDTWASTFSYIFEYMKPIGCFVQYPLVIHNQMVDERFIPAKKTYALEDRRIRRSLSNLCFSNFRSDSDNQAAFGYEGMNLPDFDDWRPSEVLPTTVKVFTAQVAISSEDKRTLLNLEELGDVKLSPDLLEWFKAGEYIHLVKAFRSIFQVSLYEDDKRLDESLYTLDPDLTVRSFDDLDIRKIYHVRLSIVTDLRYLNVKDIARVQTNPTIGLKLADAINAALQGFNGSRQDINRNRLSDEDYLLLSSMKYKPSFQRDHRPHFVNELFVPIDVRDISKYPFV
jgi:hypothetical protein